MVPIDPAYTENYWTLDELLNLHRGQGQELVWRDSLSCPTEEEYLSMVNNSEVTYLQLRRF